MPDHFVDHDLAPTVALAHAAAVTDTLRVGPLVLGNDYKHPVVLAREMATLDLLSDGRLELGIGAGWMTADYEKAGIPLDRPGVRIARLAESITILKGLFAPGPFTFHGEHYQVTELDGMPKPVQRPACRSSIGGGRAEDPRRSPRARRKIVGINANLRSGDGDVARDRAVADCPAATDQKLAWVRDAAGDGFDDLEIQSLLGFVHVTDDAVGHRRRRSRARSACRRTTRCSRRPRSSASRTSIVELLEAAARALADVVHRGRRSNATETLAPIVARLAGK